MSILINNIEFSTDDLIYLASPFTNENHSVEQMRTGLAKEALSALLRMGLKAFSPICHSALVVSSLRAKDYPPIPHDQWMKIDIDILSACKVLVVLELAGWHESEGVHAEIEFAEKNGIRTEYLTLDEIVAAAKK